MKLTTTLFILISAALCICPKADPLPAIKITKASGIALEADSPTGSRKSYNGIIVDAEVPEATQPEMMIAYGEDYFDPKLKELTKALGHDIFVIAFALGERELQPQKVQALYRVVFTRENGGDWRRAKKTILATNIAPQVTHGITQRRCMQAPICYLTSRALNLKVPSAVHPALQSSNPPLRVDKTA